MKKTINVLLVDDHSIVRLGMKSLLEKNESICVCGEAALDKSITNCVLNHIRDSSECHTAALMDREKAILELISYGKTNKEISNRLFVSEKTVRNYVSLIMKKNVSNRTEASRYWLGQKYLK